MTDSPIDWPTVQRLASLGVARATLLRCTSLRVVDGALAFYEPIDDDAILWTIATGALTSKHGRAFGLGASELSAATGALDYLRIHASPLDWLRDGGRGLVVLRWAQLFDRLRGVPRVAVAEAVLQLYRRHIRPDVPDLAVLRGERRAAA